MKLILVYLIAWLVAVVWIWSLEVTNSLPTWLSAYSIIIRCSLVGAVGGIVYCLRAIYLNRSVKNQWHKEWEVWYYIRPLVSLIMGAVAYVFLQAGLLVLDADLTGSQSIHGFLALAFIAGLNVDRFLSRIESLAESTWGIRPSRSAEKSNGESE